MCKTIVINLSFDSRIIIRAHNFALNKKQNNNRIKINRTNAHYLELQTFQNWNKKKGNIGLYYNYYWN